MDMNFLKKRRREIHPRDSAGVLSKVFFFFIIPLFRKGFKNELEEKDLFEVMTQYRSKELGDHLEEEWGRQKKYGEKLSIFRLLLKLYGLYYLLLGLTKLCFHIIILVAQPYAFGKLVSYFAPSQTNLTKTDAWFYACLVLGLNLVQCIYKHNYELVSVGLGIKIRTALCSFIYRKVLKLSQVHLENRTTKNIITLITNDAKNLENFTEYGNEVWICTVTVFVTCLILYMKIGASSLGAIGLLLVYLPIETYLGIKIVSFKRKAYKETDRRLTLTQEVLSAIKIIKMYNWEKELGARISDARNKEMSKLYKYSMLRLMTWSICQLHSHVAIALFLLTHTWLGNNITAEIVFFVITCFRTLAGNVSIQFAIGIFRTLEFIISVRRMEDLITSMEVQKEPKIQNSPFPKINLKNTTLTIKNKTIIEEVSVEIDEGLTLIAGPVSSGKTSLLKMILQEYRPQNGNVVVNGNASYASQEPWLFPSSIRQNILFGEIFNEKRYHEVLKICALLHDLELFEAGDLTIVEDRGMNLSRGQQIRINLARAIYRECEIYLLDGCLSALDAQVSAFIFSECCKKFLQNKLVILVTYNIKRLNDVDNTICLHNGKVKLLTTAAKIREGKILNNDDDEDEEDDNDNLSENNNADHDDFASEDTQLLTESIQKELHQERKKSGNVDLEIYKKYIKFGGGFIIFFVIFGLAMLTEFSMSYSQKLITSWVNLEQEISKYVLVDLTNATIFSESIEERNKTVFRFGLVIAATIVAALVNVSVFSNFIRRVSLNLHQNMLSTIINAPMQFFDTHLIGNILNRFSLDFTNLDELMPFYFLHFLKIIFRIVGIISLIAYVNIMFLIPTTIFFAILFLLRKICIRITRSLKRLEACTRSPVVGHLNATLEGLVTIRAFNNEARLRNEFDRYQDLYTSASYTYECSMKAFAFALNILCTCFTAVIVAKFLIIDSERNLAGNVGLAVSQAFFMSGVLQWLILEWTIMENIMTFSNIPKSKKKIQKISY